MTSVKNSTIAVLVGALALSIITGAAAQSQGGVTVELRVWQHVEHQDRHYISARLADGSWRTLGTVPLELDDGTSRSGMWRYGTHTFDLPVEATCASGVAVRDPSDHTELVADCRDLLPMRGWLDPYMYDLRSGWESTPLLNWSATIPMERWTGVTVGGSPRRVVKLDLSGMDLRGRVPANLGNLTGLTELRLNDSSLSGRLPSKLAQLASLTHVQVNNARFTGCFPSSLLAVASSDVREIGIPDCGPPIDLNRATTIYDLDGRYRLTGGTYRYGNTVFDIPPGNVLWLNNERVEEGTFWEFLLQTEPAEFPEWPDTLAIGQGREDGRWTSDSLFDLVSESAWVDFP